MVDIVGVRFKDNGKIYFFDPLDKEMTFGDKVVVETARGLELGTVAYSPRQVDKKEIVKPLKPVVRIANDEDIRRNEENMEKAREAMDICREKIENHGLEMKLVDVEYSFNNNKIVFYFTADGRIDFRALVKDLAAVFHTRIELRQIGVRDEAKMLGGVGCCGREMCCHGWMNDFHHVSITMAKNQNLSLNPAKISGICGRLMCCLEYENEAYAHLKKGMPNMGDRVEIDEGLAVCTECNILEQKIKCRLLEEEADKESGVPEKLSTELYTAEKGEFRLLSKKGHSQKGKGKRK